MARRSLPPASPFSLLLPDHPLWRWEDGYEPAVAPYLIRGYAQLIRGGTTVQGFHDAYMTMDALSGRSMSVRQRIRRCYLLSAAHAAVGDLAAALEWVGWALELARALPPHEEIKELQHLRRVILRGMRRVRDTAREIRE